MEIEEEFFFKVKRWFRVKKNWDRRSIGKGKELKEDRGWLLCSDCFREKQWRTSLRPMHKWDNRLYRHCFTIHVKCRNQQNATLSHQWHKHNSSLSVETNKIQLFLTPITQHNWKRVCHYTLPTTPRDNYLANTTRDLQKQQRTPVEVEPVTCRSNKTTPIVSKQVSKPKKLLLLFIVTSIVPIKANETTTTIWWTEIKWLYNSNSKPVIVPINIHYQQNNLKQLRKYSRKLPKLLRL